MIILQVADIRIHTTNMEKAWSVINEAKLLCPGKYQRIECNATACGVASWGGVASYPGLFIFFFGGVHADYVCARFSGKSLLLVNFLY